MKDALRCLAFVASLLLGTGSGASYGQAPDVYEAVSAAWDGDVETVQRFLDAGGDPNARTGDGATALIRAADGGHAHLVDLLLQAGADPNLLDAEGGSALLYAANGEHSEVVGRLLEAGADPNLRGRDDLTALIMAAEAGDAGMVRALLKAHADPNLADVEGGTALLNALRWDNAENPPDEIVHLLVDAGASLTAQDRTGRTVLMFAAARGYENVVRAALDAGAEANATDERFGITALFGAAANGHASVVRLLLDAGADPTVKTQEGKSALDYAREGNHAETVALLEKAVGKD